MRQRRPGRGRRPLGVVLGVRIRILLGDPDSAQVGVRGADEGIDDLTASKIRNVIVVYGPLRRMDGMHLRKVTGGRMVTTYLDSYEKVWSQARPLD